jgi:NhaP-type Na+/H+ and K+/H+ antiporter
MQDILRERRASNKIIDEAMSDARKLSAEALEMMREANQQMIKADEHIISERIRASAQIREERLFHSRESARLRRKSVATIDKLHREQEASMKLSTEKSNKKYDQVKLKMITISTKLKDQRIVWQKRLSELDASSKKRISTEREHRRCSIQHQLDKSSAVEDQFMEIINGLEEMNDQLAEEVKSAKKDRHVALKLYHKSKDSAKKRHEKLQLEKEEKNVLKDELTRALKMHESQ